MEAPDLDTQLRQAVSIKKMIKSLETQLTGILDTLALAVESGELDDSFTFDDATFRLSPGRASYTYPAEINEAEAALKQRKADAVAAGTATEKRGAAFWTLKLPNA